MANSQAENLFKELAEIAIKEDASDLHLIEGRVPVIRSSGFLVPVAKAAPLTRENMEGFMALIMDEGDKKEFTEKMETDFAHTHGAHRFRCNVSLSLGKICIAMRLIPNKIRSFEELNLPPILERFTTSQQGFFLVVGPTGVGKSTTLATMIETVNLARLEHIVTIEDPIEYIFESKKSIINQREVKLDTPDFPTALSGAFRQDADIIMVGEMRDPETISTAVTAAETGHLVFSTLHTNTAAQTVDRIIDSFPAAQQAQIRVQLAGSLLGIFSQRLIPRISGGLIPAYELLINNSAVANLIREKRTHEINSVIETRSEEGMIDLNRSLAEMVRNGEVTVENAVKFSTNPKLLEHMI